MLGAGLLAFFAMDCQAGIHAVEGTVPARYFDETRSTWDQTTISVFYDDARHVTLMGGHGRGKASVRMTREEFEPLVDALREGRSHLIKDLDTGEILELFRVIRGSGPYTHGMTVSYWSGSADLSGAIVLFLQDDDNPLSKMELYLDEGQTETLLSRRSAIPQ